MLTLGPFSIPGALLVLFAAMQLGQWMAQWCNRRLQGAPLQLQSHGWILPLAGVLAARCGFVGMQWSHYAASPWSVCDIRDGGWLPSAGFAVCALYCAVVWLRQRSTGWSLWAGWAVAAGVWWGGLALLGHLQPAKSPLPEWATHNLAGAPMQLSQLRGQPVVINLWASWCPPCVREMPVLRAGQQQHPDITFVWMNQREQPLTVARFAVQHQLPTADVWLDAEGFMATHSGHSALPTTLFYDGQGRLRAVRNGELSSASLAHHLQMLVAP